MRVIFTGQTGIEKSACVSRLREYVLRMHGFGDRLNSEEAKKYLRSYSIEKTIASDRDFFVQYLSHDSEAFQRDKWSLAMRKILEKISVHQPLHCFLQMHTVYYRNGWHFSTIDPELIRQFQPDVFISLIDDSFNVWQRVVSRAHNRPDMSYLRLRDIYTWRSAEVMLTDLLARHMVPRELGKGSVTQPARKQSYIVGVKHPVSMLYKALFEQEKRLSVYFSVPITDTRTDPAAVTEINGVITRLGKEFTVFNPLAIDERILLNLLQKHNGDSPDTLLVQRGDRWPVSPDEEVLQADDSEDDYPILLKRAEVDEISKEIDQQIRRRDFRLIDDCDCVVVYRPNWGGRLSRGVTAEIMYACNHSGKVIPVHVYNPVVDVMAATGSPFEPNQVISHSTMEELIKAVRMINKEPAEMMDLV